MKNYNEFLTENFGNLKQFPLNLSKAIRERGGAGPGSTIINLGKNLNYNSFMSAMDGKVAKHFVVRDDVAGDWNTLPQEYILIKRESNSYLLMFIEDVELIGESERYHDDGSLTYPPLEGVYLKSSGLFNYFGEYFVVLKDHVAIDKSYKRYMRNKASGKAGNISGINTEFFINSKNEELNKIIVSKINEIFNNPKTGLRDKIKSAAHFMSIVNHHADRLPNDLFNSPINKKFESIKRYSDIISSIKGIKVQ